MSRHTLQLCNECSDRFGLESALIFNETSLQFPKQVPHFGAGFCVCVFFWRENRTSVRKQQAVSNRIALLGAVHKSHTVAHPPLPPPPIAVHMFHDKRADYK